MTDTAVRVPPPINTATSASAATPNGRVQSWLRRPFVACLVLLAIYGACTLALNDPRGTLGTDTGGKLATLHVMDQKGTWLPEVGYWAAKSDPRGDLHPLFYTFRVDGKWVNVTTLPMIYAAYPLYELGGDRAVLLLPMLGAMFCALAARALARKLGRGSGWTAFWVLGLASPVAIYALDFWEHSLGLALMLWGIVWLLRMLDERAPLWKGVIAGACFGAAATMRTEALVYLVVGAGVACVVHFARTRALGGTLVRGTALLAGAAVPLVANQGLEQLTFGGSIRAARAAGTAADAGASVGVRLQEAFTTFLGMNRFEHTQDVLLGTLIVACLVVAVEILRRRDGGVPVGAAAALAAVAFFYLVGFGAGLGFIPGLLTASPFAAVGLVYGWRPEVRMVTVIAVAALPLVWASQYSGGAGPQWGGRYTLLSGALLLIAATIVLEGHRTALLATLAAALLVTGFGLAWLSVRSQWAASGIEHIVDRHDQAVISGEAHVLREGGAFYEPGRHWLTATDDHEFRRAVDIVRAAGDTEFAYVVADGVRAPASIGGYRRTAVGRVQFLRPDLRLEVVTYRLS